jgi:hypothetical protein
MSTAVASTPRTAATEGCGGQQVANLFGIFGITDDLAKVVTFNSGTNTLINSWETLAGLTAIANALRVGDRLLERMGPQQPHLEIAHAA